MYGKAQYYGKYVRAPQKNILQSNGEDQKVSIMKTKNSYDVTRMMNNNKLPTEISLYFN